MDFINRIVQIVRRELDRLSISVQEAGLIGQEDLSNEG